VKLYQDKRAPNPRRVRIFLAEKGLDTVEGLAAHGMSLERVDLEIGKDEHRAEWFLAKQPLGWLPVLELDDGRILRESIAICRWFEETVPEPSLFGQGAWQRAEIEMWNRHVELELYFPIMFAFRHGHPVWQGKLEQIPAFAAQSRQQAAERMAWLDRELAGRPFIAGEGFSVADITALCALDFGKLANLRVTAELPNLHRWYQAVSARPSARA
jgi:glutathione S-transferase